MEVPVMSYGDTAHGKEQSSSPSLLLYGPSLVSVTHPENMAIGNLVTPRHWLVVSLALQNHIVVNQPRIFRFKQSVLDPGFNAWQRQPELRFLKLRFCPEYDDCGAMAKDAATK